MKFMNYCLICALLILNANHIFGMKKTQLKKKTPLQAIFKYCTKGYANDMDTETDEENEELLETNQDTKYKAIFYLLPAAIALGVIINILFVDQQNS